MVDQFHRNITYLRISVTDRCNYRCLYCMDEGGVCKRSHEEVLSFEEIVEIARAAVALGIQKIRLTGGEPLLRRGIISLIRDLKRIDGLSEVTLTTNGSLLPVMAQPLKDASLDRLNISLDSFEPKTFKRITRTGSLMDVLAGINAAECAGFTGTKINCVLLGGMNESEIMQFVEWTRDHDISVRFIELMPMGVCADWPQERFVSSDTVLNAVPELKLRGREGVSEVYQMDGYRGTVGLIRPMSHQFCDHCNRIRLTSDGRLKPCLHSDDEIVLRGLHGEALEGALRRAIYQKPSHHTLSELHHSGTHRKMNEIGG